MTTCQIERSIIQATNLLPNPIRPIIIALSELTNVPKSSSVSAQNSLSVLSPAHRAIPQERKTLNYPLHVPHTMSQRPSRVVKVYSIHAPLMAQPCLSHKADFSHSSGISSHERFEYHEGPVNPEALSHHQLFRATLRSTTWYTLSLSDTKSRAICLASAEHRAITSIGRTYPKGPEWFSFVGRRNSTLTRYHLKRLE